MAKPDNTLEPRVAALEDAVTDLDQRVIALDQRVTALDDRVIALEDASIEPPDVEEPPPDIEPPDIEPPSSTATLQELVNAGGEVELPNEEYTDYCVVDKPTQVVGAPTTISAEGMTISNGKGIFVAAADLELACLTLCHAKVPSRNGAGVRVSPGVAITLTDVEIHDCEMGVLTGGGDNSIHALENCFVHDNGTGGGGAMGHELYMWSKEFWLQDSRVICGNRSTHAVKTRSFKTIITGCEIQGTSASDQSFAGSVIDLCEGGEVLIEDTTITVPATMGHSLFLGYLTENSNGGVHSVTLRNCVFQDFKGNCELWARSGAGAKLVIENCTYTAASAPRLTGWSNVQGAFVKGR
jgi:uncharacterized coiled-coil protein SlyX